MIAFIFPGQGSQKVGMGQAFAAADPIARDTFAEADAALGAPLSRLCFDGPESELTLTENTQPAILAVSSAIHAAFVYGSVAKATDQAASDIDLMIISDSLTYGDVFSALERVTRTVGRTVNPTVYTIAEFSKRARTENAFVTRVLEQEGFDVVIARHAGHALLAAIMRNNIDVMISDLALDDMTGESLASTLRRHHPALRSLYIADQVAQHPGPVLVRPFTRDELLQELSTLPLAAISQAF